MKRTHWHPVACKVCGVSGDEVGGISQTGHCPEHGYQRLIDNVIAMKTKRGPFAQWWAYKMAASVGYAPHGDPPERP